MSTPDQPAPAPARQPINVYAYGVMPLYGGPDGKHYEVFENGTVALFKPYAYLHFWIDHELNYGEETLETEKPNRPIHWAVRMGVKVELRNPRDYTITRTP